MPKCGRRGWPLRTLAAINTGDHANRRPLPAASEEAAGLSCMRAFLMPFSRAGCGRSPRGGVTIFGAGRRCVGFILAGAISRSPPAPTIRPGGRRATGLASRVKPKIKYPRSSTRKRRPSKRRSAPAAPAEDQTTLFKPSAQRRFAGRRRPGQHHHADGHPPDHQNKLSWLSFAFGTPLGGPARTCRRSPPPACHRGSKGDRLADGSRRRPAAPVAYRRAQNLFQNPFDRVAVEQGRLVARHLHRAPRRRRVNAAGGLGQARRAVGQAPIKRVERRRWDIADSRISPPRKAWRRTAASPRAAPSRRAASRFNRCRADQAGRQIADPKAAALGQRSTRRSALATA